MKGAQYTIDHVTGYVREFVFNPETIDENVRKILYDYDIKESPLYKIRRAIGGTWKLFIVSGGFQKAPKAQILQDGQILLNQTQRQLPQLPR